ncbi:hypothetical protein AT239_03265 [Bartonella henselae]|nr:hypothetical protein AT239_03265 [Bartonella henselae]OLL56238.1 hypothetical protein AT240_06130 [Bartonella henselae]
MLVKCASTGRFALLIGSKRFFKGPDLFYVYFYLYALWIHALFFKNISQSTQEHFTTVFVNGIMMKPWYTAIFTLMKQQVSTTILFASFQCCDSPCIEMVHKGHFSSFK